MFDKLKDVDYLEHPDTIELTIGGDEYPWFIGRKSFRLSKAEDVDLGAILGGLENAREEVQDGAVEERFDDVAKVVWGGFLVFDDAPQLEVVEDALSFQDIPRVLMQISAEFNRLQQLAPGQEAGQGNPTKLSKTVTKSG